MIVLWSPFAVKIKWTVPHLEGSIRRPTSLIYTNRPTNNAFTCYL